MPSKYPKLVIEAWSIYEAMRKLGFQDDDIDTVIGAAMNPVSGEVSDNMVYVMLRANGLRFVYTLTESDIPFEEFRDQLALFRANIMNGSIGNDALAKMWRATDIGKHKDLFATLALKIIEKGIRVPAMEN